MWKGDAIQHAVMYMRFSTSVRIPCSNLSYIAVMLTATAALTPPPAYTNIYITPNGSELGSKMYIAWLSLM